jgi:PBP1b-binding outer membrane lipoprotein LpoB
MKTKILLSILFGAMVLVACKKDPPIPETTAPVMPPLTHQGLNTFEIYL